jgi:hypothetical protein
MIVSYDMCYELKIMNINTKFLLIVSERSVFLWLFVYMGFIFTRER